MEKKKAKKSDFTALWSYSLRTLGARPYSSAELRKKLLGRAEKKEDVPQVLAKLREYGYLDDRRFAESFASARLENQGLGRIRVLRDLRAKQISSNIADEAVSKTYAETDEQELVRQYLAKKYRHTDLAAYLADERHLASAYRRLRTAGFSSGASIRVLKQYASQAEQMEDWENAEDPADS